MEDVFISTYKLELMYLLAIIYINFRFHKLSSKNKFEKFLDFCNDEIKAFHLCSCNLAKIFYDNPSLRFFRKIQTNNPNIFKDIENMAWDIFHLRLLEISAGASNMDKETIMYPIFISKDKGLNEIRHVYQVKCLFQNKKTGETHSFYNMNSINSHYKQKYFNSQAINKRMTASEYNLDCNIKKYMHLIDEVMADLR